MSTPSLFDLDIFRVSRPWSEFDYDVWVGNEWIASAKNYHSADDTAAQAWHRATLEQPVIADAPAGNTDRDGDDGEGVNWNSATTTDTPLLDDLANVLTLTLSQFVGKRAIRFEIERVLSRYATEHFVGADLSAEAQRAAIEASCARMLVRDPDLIAA